MFGLCTQELYNAMLSDYYKMRHLVSNQSSIVLHAGCDDCQVPTDNWTYENLCNDVQKPCNNPSYDFYCEAIGNLIHVEGFLEDVIVKHQTLVSAAH